MATVAPEPAELRAARGSPVKSSVVRRTARAFPMGGPLMESDSFMHVAGGAELAKPLKRPMSQAVLLRKVKSGPSAAASRMTSALVGNRRAKIAPLVAQPEAHRASVRQSMRERKERSHRRVSTASEKHYPMYVVPMSRFLSTEFTKFEPHQDLLASGKVIEATPAMVGNIIFVSHQWVGFDHPDPDGEQFAALRIALTRLISGKVNHVQTSLFGETYLGEREVVTADEWKKCLPKMFLWLDFQSIPQPAAERIKLGLGPDDKHKRVAKLEDGLAAAVNSIPSYVEWCSLMILLVPVVRHKSLEDAICGYDTWRNRGWCRVELMGAHVARNHIRVMVVRGGYARPYFSGSFETMRLPALEGEFTCCQRGHVSSTNALIPCDKPKVQKILKEMLDAKVTHLAELGLQIQRRYYVSAMHWFFRGSLMTSGSGECTGSIVEALRRTTDYRSPNSPTGEETKTEASALARLIRKLDWKEKDDAAGEKTGFSLLVYAIIANDLPALLELLEKIRSDPKAAETLGTLLNMGIPRDYPGININCGQNPLALAMVYSSFPVITTLLDAGASPEGVDAMGRDAFLWGATNGRASMLEQWIERLPSYDLESNFYGSFTALIAALHASSNPLGVAKVLIKHGAEVFNVHRGLKVNALIAAAPNYDIDGELVDYLLANTDLDVNSSSTPPSRGLRFKLGCARLACKMGLRLPKSVKNMLRYYKATALHHTVARGIGGATRALVAAGADTSRRNGLGKTPYQMAELTYGKGHVPEVLIELLGGKK